MPSRHLVQPGPPSPVRVLSAVGRRVRDIRLHLPAGVTLLDAVRDALDGLGARSASLLLSYGRFADFRYHLPGPGPQGGKVVLYGPALVLAPPVALLGACAIYGLNEDGPVLHCHGAVTDAEGRAHGGHLAVDQCVIGDGGIVAFASCLDDAGFATRFDEETTFKLLQPYGGLEDAA